MAEFCFGVYFILFKLINFIFYGGGGGGMGRVWGNCPPLLQPPCKNVVCKFRSFDMEIHS